MDLAGSEKPRRTKHHSKAFAEGVMINKSLTTLSHVLKQLGDGCDKPSFRNSKLTRLPVWIPKLQPDFNVLVLERFGPSSLAVLRELDESDRFAQKSAESTLI